MTRLNNADYRKIIIAKESTPLIALITGKDFCVCYYAQLVFHGIPEPELIEPIQQIHAFISDNMSWCTTGEFKLAFELNAAGKLKARHNPFKSFDSMYVGAVLSDYYEMRLEALKKWNEVNVNYIAPARQLAASTETYDEKEMFMTALSSDIARAKNGGNLTAATLLGAVYFEKLFKYNLVDDAYWSELEWSNFKRKSKAMVLHDQSITRTKFERIKQNPRMLQLYQQDVKNEMKRMMYVDYIIKQSKLP